MFDFLRAEKGIFFFYYYFYLSVQNESIVRQWHQLTNVHNIHIDVSQKVWKSEA